MTVRDIPASHKNRARAATEKQSGLRVMYTFVAKTRVYFADGLMS